MKNLLKPLTMCKPGCEVVIDRINGGCKAKKRLLNMGICPGKKCCIQNNIGCNLVLKLNDSKIAMGMGIATKVFVKEI